jgi:S1-C subfamily serine protease
MVHFPLAHDARQLKLYARCLAVGATTKMLLMRRPRAIATGTPAAASASACHVVGSNATVSLEREGVRLRAAVTSANADADRCVLSIGAAGEALPKWVRVRPYADVKVGERAFTVGAPQGLELSLAEGIISSKRAVDAGRLFQTSAPISKGSSAGGLFDAHGDLLGITTFILKDAQNLNFAIAAEEYAK